MKTDDTIEREPDYTTEQRHDEDASSSSLPAYANNFDGHLPLHWLQPKADETDETLPSFRDLRLKTHQTLYGTTTTMTVPPRDKSPKGSVDAPIRHLVDLINSHSRFCTLSSCSGRLSLFDPTGNGNSGVGNGEINNNNINGAVKASNNHFTEASGKGRGRWVLVSHDPISPDALVEAMVVTQSEPEALCCGANDEKHDDDDDDEEDDEEKESKHIPSPWTFRFEPMLLHIAAASLQDGRRLLTIALNLGFRESGLVVTDKRVTVAIRSHSLATATPLFPSSGKASDPLSPSSFLCVPPSFLRALANDANQRLEANWSHLDRLYRSIESTLFEVLSSPPPLVVRNQSTEIPTLNLWNAASIGPAVSNANFLERKQDVWILGGYGCGPNVSGKKRPSAKRSSKLYRLEEAGWREHSMSSQRNGAACGEPGVLKLARGNHETTIDTRMGVNWWNDESKAVPDLQGMASCRWRKDLSLFWGGRKGPSTPAPSDDLYVLEDSSERIGTVRDIRGELPRPRWGHQLVSLDDDRAVLLGGCNLEDGALDDVFVLHFCTETVNGSHATDDTSLCGYFYWERLSIRLPTPRFHFGAALLNGSTIVVVGGLESTQELLQPFEGNIEPSRSESAAVWACRFKRSRPTCKSKSTAPKTRATSVRVETPVGAFTSFFGMACCTLLSKNLLLVTGGIQQNASTTTTPSEPIQAYWISGGDSSTLRIQRIHLSYDVGNFDFGCLVHHCCIPLADNELLLVGGGVPSFAFGESYSRSHHLLIDTDNSSRKPKTDRTAKRNGRTDSINMNLKKQHGENDSLNGAETKEVASVVYVAPKDARQAKNSLQQKGWLEKRYRMIKVEHKSEANTGDSTNTITKQAIAIPISAPFSDVIGLFGEHIFGHGEEELPLSTSQYASKTKQKK